LVQKNIRCTERKNGLKEDREAFEKYLLTQNFDDTVECKTKGAIAKRKVDKM
jgi:hypothetical protein